VVFKLLVWCGAEGYASGLQHPANRTHNPQLHTRPTTWKPQDIIPYVVKISVLHSWRWAKYCPKHVELILEINKLLFMHLGGSSTLLYLFYLLVKLFYRSRKTFSEVKYKVQNTLNNKCILCRGGGLIRR